MSTTPTWVQNQCHSWELRHRPDALDDMALDPELRQRFAQYLNGDVLSRHLILSGPPGFGKTTIATIIAKKYGVAVMRVTATQTGNVEFIRTTVINFMRSAFFGSKLVIFEEASGLSAESQAALRVPMEQWSDDCQIIFLTNTLDKLDKAVRDRCDVIEMTRPPIPECARVLGAVLTAEGIDADPTTVEAFTRWHFAVAADDDHRSMRGLLRAAQDAITTDGKLPDPPPEAERSPALMLEEWRSEYRPEDATDGAKLLNNLADAFATYLSLPKGGKETLALWTVFAWAHEAFTISPIITLTSPTMRAGKSTAFELLEQLLIPGATYHPSSMTPAVVYRLKGLAEAGQDAPPSAFEPPTLCLLMDEADNWLGNHQLRAVLNSGWKRRGAKVARMVGAEPGWFSSWYPKALALIDRADAPLPGTLRDRSIIVPMQRKSKDETVTPFPGHQLRVPELEALSKATLYWGTAHFTTLRDLGGGAILADGGLNDRARNNWHPLMCIASVASSDWAKRARRASLIISAATRDTELLIELLADVKAVFDAAQVDALRSVVLVEKLVALEARPWKERRLTPIKFATMLRPLHIESQQLWTSMGLGAKGNLTGYTRGQFEESWRRYEIGADRAVI